MSDALVITEADALGLAEVAEIQLKLARKFAARAEAEEDVDRACKLARAAERAARGYRQSLLLKSRLLREDERARREAGDTPRPRSPQQQARIDRRVRQLYEAVQDHIYAEREAERLDDDDAALRLLFNTIQNLAETRDAFAEEDLGEQVGQVCARLRLPRPVTPPLGPHPGATAPPRAAADSS